MNRTLLFLLLTGLVWGLPGCWAEKNVENIGVVLQLGIENTSDGRLMETSEYILVGGKQKNIEEQLVTESINIRESRDILQRVASKKAEGGKLQQILFSDKLARQGIHDYIEVFERDSLNPPLASIAIVDGSPKELMEKALQFKNKPPSALYIGSLLTNNAGSYIPDTQVITYDIAYFAPGIDPTAPIIRLAKDHVEVIGTALFSGDRMVGRIGPQDGSLLLALMGQLKPMDYIFELPGIPKIPMSIKRGAAVLFSQTKPTIKMELREGKPVARVSLNINGKMDEYQWDRLDDPAIQKKLEKAMSAELVRQIDKLLRYLQQAGSDPLGFGDMIRAKYNPYWQSHAKSDIYRQLQFQVRVKLKIQQYGAIR